MKYDYNLIVIGAGSGGLVSAYIAAAVKAKVALIEGHKMGGDCLNTGCVPSKALIKTAKILSYAKKAKELGLETIDVKMDFAKVMERVQNVIKKIEPHDSMERYEELGVECFQGFAKLKSAHEVELDGKIMTAKNIIVATGAKAFVPPFEGLDKIDYLTSDNLWEIRELPKRLLVLGGGPIGVEMAQAFNRLGSEVTVIQNSEHIFPREDKDVALYVQDTLLKEGMKILTSHQAKRFVKEGDTQSLVCEYDGKEVKVEFDKVLIALGRRANVKGFGLEELGVEIRKNSTIEANDFLQTNIPSIYVCGDVTGPYQFTHTAAHQAWYASVNALFKPFKKFKVDYRIIPWATFTDPEVASVGINEQVAKERGIAYEVTKYGIDDLDRAIADSEDYGFVKVLTVPGKDVILGVCIVGSRASELIAEYILAMKYNIGLNKILGTIHIYPTQSEANKFAAGEWKRAHVPELAMKILKKFHEWRR